MELHSFKHKVITTLIITVISYVGFQVLSFLIGNVYQPGIYFNVALYLYVFHIFWLTLLFDLHFKKRDIIASLKDTHKGFKLIRTALLHRISHLLNWHYFRKYLNFLILPSVIFWALVVVLYLNPFRPDLKQMLIFFSTASLAVVYWYLKDIYTKNFELHHIGVRFLTLAKVYAAFLFYSSIVGFCMYFGLGEWSVFIYSFIVTFLLIYQALFQHKYAIFKTYPVIMGISFLMSVCAVVLFRLWNYEYFGAGLLLAAVFNSCWGFFHHQLEGNLTRKLVIEYFLLLVLISSFILGTHDFTPRINP